MQNSKDYLTSELEESTNPNGNSSLPPSQVTTQQVRQVVIGSENNNENFQQQSSNGFLGTVPTTSVSDESKPQISSGSTALPIPVVSNTNIDINSTLCKLLQQNQLLINHLLDRDKILQCEVKLLFRQIPMDSMLCRTSTTLYRIFQALNLELKPETGFSQCSQWLDSIIDPKHLS